MATDCPTQPAPIPDPATVARVIQLASAAERCEQRPATWPRYCLGGLDDFTRPTPVRHEFVAYFGGLPEEDVACLDGLYRVGALAGAGHAAAEVYGRAYDLARVPMHAAHGAADLAAKASLAGGLRRGLAHLGLPLGEHPSRPGDQLHGASYLED